MRLLSIRLAIEEARWLLKCLLAALQQTVCAGQALQFDGRGGSNRAEQSGAVTVLDNPPCLSLILPLFSATCDRALAACAKRAAVPPGRECHANDKRIVGADMVCWSDIATLSDFGL